MGGGGGGGGGERAEPLIDLNISTCTATVAGQGRCISIIIIALCGYPIVKMEIRDVKSFEK